MYNSRSCGIRKSFCESEIMKVKSASSTTPVLHSVTCSTSLVITNAILLKLCLAVLEQIVLWVINWWTSEVAVSSIWICVKQHTKAILSNNNWCSYNANISATDPNECRFCKFSHWFTKSFSENFGKAVHWLAASTWYWKTDNFQKVMCQRGMNIKDFVLSSPCILNMKQL